MASLCFNQVCVQKPGGGTNLLSPDSYLSISFVDRTELMLAGKVTFLNSGTIVHPMEAVKSIAAFRKS